MTDLSHLRSLAENATQGARQVVVTEHPWSLPARTVQGEAIPASAGHHIERRIFTVHHHPQSKAPISIVNGAVGIGPVDGKPISFVTISEEDATFIAACSSDVILSLLDRVEKAEAACTPPAIAKNETGIEPFGFVQGGSHFIPFHKTRLTDPKEIEVYSATQLAEKEKRISTLSAKYEQWFEEAQRAYKELAEITRQRDEMRSKWEAADGLDGAVVHAIRDMLNAADVPARPFIDDHVGMAIAQRDEARARVQVLEAGMRAELKDVLNDLRWSEGGEMERLVARRQKIESALNGDASK